MYSMIVSNRANLPYYLSMQADGNLVLYTQILPIWASQTSNLLTQPRLDMQDDGNLVLYNPSNVPYWASQTASLTLKFKSQATARCLDCNANGNVYTSTCISGFLNQNWYFERFLGGFFTIMNKATGLYLTDSGSTVLIRAEDGSQNQDWIIDTVTTQFINRATTKALESNAVRNVFSSINTATMYQKWSLF